MVPVSEAFTLATGLLALVEVLAFVVLALPFGDFFAEVFVAGALVALVAVVARFGDFLAVVLRFIFILLLNAVRSVVLSG
jgi:hypothetical protein